MISNSIYIKPTHPDYLKLRDEDYLIDKILMLWNGGMVEKWNTG